MSIAAFLITAVALGGLGGGLQRRLLVDDFVAEVEGVVVEALNVKTALFFLAFLPQFALASEPLVPQLVLPGSIWVALNRSADVMAVLAAYRLLKSDRARAARARVLTRVSGAPMLDLDLHLAQARREA